jgi:hypothetical protein
MRWKWKSPNKTMKKRLKVTKWGRTSNRNSILNRLERVHKVF